MAEGDPAPFFLPFQGICSLHSISLFLPPFARRLEESFASEKVAAGAENPLVFSASGRRRAAAVVETVAFRPLQPLLTNAFFPSLLYRLSYFSCLSLPPLASDLASSAP